MQIADNDAILNKINLETYKSARVISLSPQGDSVYAVLRLIPESNDGLNTIVGNYKNVPEHELTMAEALIPTDLDPTSYHGDMGKFLNRRVSVLFRGERAIMAHLKYQPVGGPRTISSDLIQRARDVSPSRGLNTPEAKAFLLAMGHTEEDISAITGETINSKKPEGFVLKYGEVSSWHKATVKDGENEKNISSGHNKTVTGLPQTFLKNVFCHKPVKVISGR